MQVVFIVLTHCERCFTHCNYKVALLTVVECRMVGKQAVVDMTRECVSIR